MFPKSIAFVVLFVLVLAVATNLGVYGQIAYTRHLSDLRIKELQNLAVRLEHSVVNDANPCEDYYVHVCSRNRPMFSIMGSLPSEINILRLLIDLQNDQEIFDAKSKVTKFSISCGAVKSVDDCYRETFNFFRPLFGYIVAKKHLESQDYKILLELLDRFLAKVNVTEHFGRHSLRYKLEELKDKLKHRHELFKVEDLNKEFESVKIYPDSYEHNVKSLEELQKGNSSYRHGIFRTILDWNLYLYQSRNKPMSYYYATLNVHLWMMFYNSSSRMDQRKYEDKADCLKLPAALNALEEARLLSVIYIQSFNNAWIEYRQWITSSSISEEIYNHENEILKPYQLDNKRLFFTLYAQNFCDFGKSLAESVFFLGLKQNVDFYNVYKCGYQTLKSLDCLERQ